MVIRDFLILSKILPFHQVIIVHVNYSTKSCNIKILNRHKVFKGKVFRVLNVNSVLPKIELIYLLLKSNLSVLVITESNQRALQKVTKEKLEGNLNQSDNIKNGGGIACFIKNQKPFNQGRSFRQYFENNLIDILLHNSKPFTLVIIQEPSSQSSFINALEELASQDTLGNQFGIRCLE